MTNFVNSDSKSLNEKAEGSLNQNCMNQILGRF